MFKFEEAVRESSEYFCNDELAANVFITKYALTDKHGNLHEKTPDDMHRRLAREFARVESTYPNPLSEEEIYGLFKDFRFIIPQGSPMSGIGIPYQVIIGKRDLKENLIEVKDRRTNKSQRLNPDQTFNFLFNEINSKI